MPLRQTNSYTLLRLDNTTAPTFDPEPTERNPPTEGMPTETQEASKEQGTQVLTLAELRSPKAMETIIGRVA